MDQGQLNQFCELLKGLMSPSNEVRKPAEQQYQNTKAQNPDQVTQALLAVITSPERDATLRQQASILLRQNMRVLREKDFVWPKLSEPTKQAVKSSLLSMVASEANKTMRHKICDCIGELGGYLCADNSNNQWPELLPTLLQMIASNEAAPKESGLRILVDLIPAVGSMLMQNSANDVVAVLKGSMEHSDIQVKVQAVKVICSIVESLPTRHWKPVQALCPMVLSTIQSLCTGTMDDEVNDCLESLIGVADEEPAYFRPYLAELCRTGFGIAQAKDAIEDGPRQLAFEMITSLAEKKAKMCMKVPNFITDAVKTCLIFMLEIDGDGDDTEAWCKRFADQDDDEDVTNYEVGEENIDRFAQALGAEKTLPVVFQAVAEFIRIGTWKHKVAAIMTLSQVAEVVEEETQMDEIVKLLLQHMGDQHPRVRYAALHAMGQTATDCTPYVQEAWSQEVLTALEKAMDDPIPRVASHACAAFVNYAEDVEQEALIPHVKVLMEKLYRKLQMDQPRQIREQAITAIAVIAGVSESHFVNYYSHIMPLLKQTVQQASSKDERTLRGKAFECLSLLGLAVGKEVFANDAVEAMQAIVSMLREPEKHFEDDDPLKGFVLESLQRISKTLGSDFGQFLPALLPLILSQLSLTAAEVDDASEQQDMTMIMLAEGKCVGLKTSAIEDLASALQTISCFIENCGPAVYNPYVKDTALKLRPLLDFQFNDEVKSLAVNVWSELISCARRANDTATVQDLLNSFVESMLKAMAQEDELELLEAEARGVANCVKNAGPGTLSEQAVSHIVEVCFTLLKESFNRRADATAEEESGECDEDEVDEIRNIKEMDECVRIAITEIGGALMREHKQLFVSTGGLQKSIELVQKLIDTRCMAQDRCLALYIVCDFLECLGPDSVQAWSIFMEPMVAAITDNNSSIRQAAAYGANVACNIPQFGDIAATAAAQLYRAMQRPDARSKDNIAAHENAVAALGNVCEKFEQRLGNDAGNYWAAWIKNLPIKQDEDEGKKTHAQLVRLVKEQRPGVLGANNSNLGVIVHVLALVYKKDYSNALIDRAICEVLAGLGEATIGGLQGSLNDKSKKGVMRILNDAKSM